VAYNWGWVGDPWYGYYAGYFTPYPVYASPSLWLTDYLMAQTLQAAYLERSAELANAQANWTPMTPEVKQQIAEEVRRQITLENYEAGADPQTAPDPGSSGVERMLGGSQPRVFVVSSPLYVESAAGECAVTAGDVLGLQPGAQPDLPLVYLRVVSSKPNECSVGLKVSVGVAELQEMQNHMRASIDRGLADLSKKQGQEGIPPIPGAAAGAPVQSGYAALAPPPDPNVATELKSQTSEGDQAQSELLHQAGLAGAEPIERPAWKPLMLGQTIEEVKAILGEPQNTVDLGTMKIYIFPRVKVTFTDGRATKFE
jgi:hypothetical protein